MQLQYSFVKCASESVAFRHLPLSVDYRERYFFIRCRCFKPYDQGVFWVNSVLEIELRRSRFVKQLRVENVELVALHHLWRRVVLVVMHLVVLVPFVALLDTVVVPRFSWHIRDCAFSDWLVWLRSLLLYDVCEFNLILTKSLFLNLAYHLEWCVFKPVIVHDIEPDACIERSFFNFVG